MPYDDLDKWDGEGREVGREIIKKYFKERITD